MMSLPLVVELRRSRRLQFFLLVVHFAAALCVWPLQWPSVLLPAFVSPLLIPLLLDCLVAASLWRSLARLAAPEFTRLRLGERGELAACDAAGEWRDFSVAADTSLLPGLVVLRLRPLGDAGKGRGVRSLALPVDALVDAAQFRSLRVWLRWRAGASAARNA